MATNFEVTVWDNRTGETSRHEFLWAPIDGTSSLTRQSLHERICAMTKEDPDDFVIIEESSKIWMSHGVAIIVLCERGDPGALSCYAVRWGVELPRLVFRQRGAKF